MASAIYSKSDAICKYERQKIKDIKLFQEDTNAKGSKRFYTIDPNIIYNKMIANKKSHFYEFWTDNMKIAFSLDLDMNGIIDYDQAIKIVKENILKVCQGAKKYYNYDYLIEKIIILESDPKYSQLESNKFSYHIIFRGLCFQNHLVAKDFYLRLHKDYILDFSDVSIYNLSCLRTCYSSKAGKKSILMPIELTINDFNTCSDTNSELDPYQFWLRTLITSIYPSEKEICQSDMLIPITKMKIEDKIENAEKKSDISNVNLEEILFKLPDRFYDDYDTWIKCGMILSSISTDNKSFFDLWDRWSAQSNKYDKSKMDKLWIGFNKSSGSNKLTIGTLIKWCQNEGIKDIFIKTRKSFTDIIQEYPIKPIIINIQDSNCLELNQNKLTPNIYKPFLNTRLLAIQSEKGTGKTSNLFKCLFDKNNAIITDETTMLFVSSRRTFGVKLLGDLKEFGFKLYSDIPDSDIYAKRIICQIDSLGRLCRDSYDYIIIDECESLARYTTSSHFTKNPKSNIIISHLSMRVSDAKHIIIMDADLSDRCIEYYKKIISIQDKDDMQLIINNYKPFTDYEIISLTFNDWLRKVLDAIGEDKKIIIPMASNNKAKDLKTKIEQDYPDKKILLIHKETDDNDKVKNLINVNETWGEYDIVIYTPSVCMGVSYDVPNVFDSIYAYGCENSLGAQEFCQMLHRVREPINKTIYISIALYKEFNLVEDVMNYQSVEQVLCSDYYLTHFNLHNNLIPAKINKIEIKDTINDNIQYDRILQYPYKEDPNYDLFVRNCWETIENKLNFSASFYGYVKFKGYKLSHYIYDEKNKEIAEDMKDIKKIREGNEKETNIQGVLQAPDISKDDFITLLKQKDEYLEEKDIQAIQRYRFKNCFKIDQEELNYDLVEEYNTKDKMKWYYNLSNIMETENQTTEMKLEIMKSNISLDKWINSCYMDFTTKNTYSNNLFAINIINLTGFNINDPEITIPLNVLETNIIDCINYIDKNKREISYKFGLKSYNKIIIGTEFKEQIKIINSIIYSQYGFKIKKISKTKKNQESNDIIYQIVDDDIWKTLFETNKKVIEPIELFSKENNIVVKQYDNSLLDYFADDDN